MFLTQYLSAKNVPQDFLDMQVKSLIQGNESRNQERNGWIGIILLVDYKINQ